MIVEANVAVDGGVSGGLWWFLFGGGNYVHHMADSPNSRDAAHMQAVAHYQQKFAQACAMARTGMCTEALTAFGQGLHTLQDRHAHSGAYQIVRRIVCPPAWGMSCYTVQETKLVPAVNGFPITDREHKRLGLIFSDFDAPSVVPARYDMASASTMEWMNQFKSCLGCCCSLEKVSTQPADIRSLCEK